MAVVPVGVPMFSVKIVTCALAFGEIPNKPIASKKGTATGMRERLESEASDPEPSPKGLVRSVGGEGCFILELD